MRKYTVDGWNNFCRVFKLPDSFPSEFCFGGGVPVNFQMVDWFNPIPELSIPTVNKTYWLKFIGEIETKEIDLDELEKTLIPFLQKKVYVKQNKDYLILYKFGASTIFNMET